MEVEAYVINLDRRPDRKEHVARQCAGAGIRWRRFPAIDAKSPDWCPPHYRLHNPPSPYWIRNDSELACFESHRSVWKMISEGGRPAVVFEDDIILSKSAGRVIAKLADDNEKYDMIKLDGVPSASRLGPSETIGGCHARPLTHVLTSAAAYLLTPRGADILTEESLKYIDYLDLFITRQHPGYRAYQLVPAIAVQCWFVDLSSFDGVSEETIASDNITSYYTNKRKDPLVYRLNRKAKRVGSSMAKYFWRDRSLVKRGGLVGQIPTCHDLPPYRKATNETIRG